MVRISMNKSFMKWLSVSVMLMSFLSMSLGVFASEVQDSEMDGSVDIPPVSVETPVDVVTGSDAALLSEINAQLADITTPSLLNVNSTQLNYFKTYLAARPFVDYVVTYDGEQEYVLYYGYGLAGSADYVRIYRTSSSGYNYNYVISTGKAAVPSSNIYIDSREGVNCFAEIESLKWQALLCIAVVLLVGLWVLSRILFR